MAEEIHHTHSTNDTSAATILVSVVIVLIVALAFYFGVVRGNIGGSGESSDVNVELNAPANGLEGAVPDGGGGLEY